MHAMRRRTILLAALALALSLGGGALYLARRTANAIGDAYAGWWVADMVIEHMETHDGAWPRGWDDLREPYETCVRRSGQPWTFEQLRSRVDVDWGADPVQLAASLGDGPGPPFRVIWLRSGGHNHWEGREPNRMIYDYLRGRKPGR
jgi:hypothetical protein